MFYVFTDWFLCHAIHVFNKSHKTAVRLYPCMCVLKSNLCFHWRCFIDQGARRKDVYKRDASLTSWRFHNRAWQPRRHDRLPETSGTQWIHRGALTNQRCSLATGCGIKEIIPANNCTMHARAWEVHASLTNEVPGVMWRRFSSEVGYATLPRFP